jgi:hypothetical protein
MMLPMVSTTALSAYTTYISVGTADCVRCLIGCTMAIMIVVSTITVQTSICSNCILSAYTQGADVYCYQKYLIGDAVALLVSYI